MPEQLRLDNQLCFRLYSASRLVMQSYQPALSALGLTYPQYLVLMVLWEKDGQPVNDIARRLYLETNTVTPLLKRMEAAGLVTRHRRKSGAAAGAGSDAAAGGAAAAGVAGSGAASSGVECVGTAGVGAASGVAGVGAAGSGAAGGGMASGVDGRQVIVSLTDKGRALEQTLSGLPAQVGRAVLCDSVTPDTVPDLFRMLDGIICKLAE